MIQEIFGVPSRWSEKYSSSNVLTELLHQPRPAGLQSCLWDVQSLELHIFQIRTTFPKVQIPNFAKWKMTTLEPHLQKFQISQCRITFPKVKDDYLGASLLVTGVPRLRQTLCYSNITENIILRISSFLIEWVCVIGFYTQHVVFSCHNVLAPHIST